MTGYRTERVRNKIKRQRIKGCFIISWRKYALFTQNEENTIIYFVHQNDRILNIESVLSHVNVEICQVFKINCDGRKRKDDMI